VRNAPASNQETLVVLSRSFSLDVLHSDDGGFVDGQALEASKEESE
jgi:hypothetical protein